MTTKKESSEMTEKERIEWLKEIIQRNYNDDNWYGYNQKRAMQTIAAQVELIGKGIIFKPTYNCPA